MIVNADSLRKDTVALIKLIDTQIEQVQIDAKALGTTPERLQDSSGSWVMIPLLLAKAQAYNTLVLLQLPKK